MGFSQPRPMTGHPKQLPKYMECGRAFKVLIWSTWTLVAAKRCAAAKRY
jgi:hypothetical protein